MEETTAGEDPCYTNTQDIKRRHVKRVATETRHSGATEVASNDVAAAGARRENSSSAEFDGTQEARQSSVIDNHDPEDTPQGVIATEVNNSAECSDEFAETEQEFTSVDVTVEFIEGCYQADNGTSQLDVSNAAFFADTPSFVYLGENYTPNYTPVAVSQADREGTLQISFSGETVDTLDISRNRVTFDNTGNAECYFLLEVQQTKDNAAEVIVRQEITHLLDETVDTSVIAQKQSQNSSDAIHTNNLGTVSLCNTEIDIELLDAPEITLMGQNDDAKAVLNQARRKWAALGDVDSPDKQKKWTQDERTMCKQLDTNADWLTEQNKCGETVQNRKSLMLFDALSDSDFDTDDGSVVPSLLSVRN